MKKTFKTMLALMAGAMTFTGCTSDILENTPEQIPSALKPMTFTAIQEEQGDATRTAIDGTAINWTENDAISIFDGVADTDGNFARKFTLTSAPGSTSGTFDGTAKEDAEAYYALYPCVESVYKETEDVLNDETIEKLGIKPDDVNYVKEEYQNCLKEGDYDMAWDMLNEVYYIPGFNNLSDEIKDKIKAYVQGETVTIKVTESKGVQRDGDNFTNVVLPAEQTVAEGQYVDPKAMLMIGKSTDASTIQFKNVCAFVKVTPTFDCTSISLKSNGTEKLAGILTVNYNNGVPTTTVTENGTNEVFLTGTIAANNTYYIAVRPETLNSGFTIHFKSKANRRYEKSTSKKVTFTRSEVLNLGSTENLEPIPIKGAAKRTGDIDVNWVQLWDNGPKFAEYNIGASSATDFGGSFEWSSTDIATTQWGSKWRMPTQAELKELINSDNCVITWTDNYNGTGIAGRIFTGKDTAYASNSIFLPEGYYWSSTSKDDTYAWGLGNDTRNPFMGLYNYDISARAVLAE